MIKPEPFSIRKTSVSLRNGYSVGEFFAMGCPCQILMETSDKQLAEQLTNHTRDEAWRLEALWSRYLSTSFIEQLNRKPNKAISVDGETAAILNYCEELWRLSDGSFDITSGVLREAWTFDGGTHVPEPDVVAKILERVGWDKVIWNNDRLQMQIGMQIDFGGVGKEYAVDLCCRRLIAATDISCLVNFGGDCAATREPVQREGWGIGIESADQAGQATNILQLKNGAVATSGNSHRFVLHQGKRLSHILDARTGWPVVDAPRSITVAADTCLQAGMFATLACLHGSDASAFLDQEDVKHWVQV